MNHIDILEAADQYYLASITWQGKKCAFFILPGTVLACTDGRLPNHISGDLQFFIDLLISIILIVILFISIIIFLIVSFMVSLMVIFMVIFMLCINGYHPHDIPDHIHEMIIIVIKVIFMNLLIAIMNTTMQEVHDKKLLYWKFVRAGILLMMMILDDDNLEEGRGVMIVTKVH